MNDETMILEPLVDAPINNGYRPNFSLISKQEKDAQLRDWAKDLMADADAEGNVLLPYSTMLAGLAKILGYHQVFLHDDPWRLRDALFRAGLGAAPDGVLERFSLKGHDNVVLYPADQEVPGVKTRQYKKALMLVKFATLMLPDLDEGEMKRIGTMIDQWVRAPRYRRHLRALLRWYNQRRRLLDARTKRMFRTIMGPDDMAQLSQQLLSIAAARGAALDAKAVYQLDRLLVLCGHAPGEVHSLLHRMQCGQRSIAEHYGAPETVAPIFDMSHLALIEKETQQVQALLSDYLSDAEEHREEALADSNAIIEPIPESALHPHPGSISTVPQPSIPQLWKKILEKEVWPLSALESLCAAEGMKMSVVLEQINDRAMDEVGDTIIDIEGDNAYVTQDYVSEFIK